MSCLAQIDFKHVLHPVMMSLRSNVSTFLPYPVSPHPDPFIHCSILGASSMSSIPVHLKSKVIVIALWLAVNESAQTLHEKHPSVEMVLSSAGGI